MASAYPAGSGARDRWIVERRPPKRRLDPLRAYGAFVEEEARPGGGADAVATILLTNRECPWRCLMCDLFLDTLDVATPPGAIPSQIRAALAALPAARRVKLYNAGSFFDPHAIPEADHAEIAALVRGFDTVIVESHPSLVGERCARFRDLLDGARLEVALGLETVHEEVLEKLNKRMTLDGFRAAASRLAADGIAVRAFVLAGLPFLGADEALEWTKRALAFAFEVGVAVVSLVPLRGGNGAMEALARAGDYAPPALADVEEAAAYGLGLGRGVVLVDLWELERFARCTACFAARRERLRVLNVAQRLDARAPCAVCGS